MKKTTTMIIIILSFVLLGIGITMSNPQQTAPLSPKQTENRIADENEEDTSSDAPVEESTNSEIKTPADEISKEIEEVIQSTIEFFSDKETKVVAIGDSLTQGVGDQSEQGGYVGILDAYLNREKQVAVFENYGKRGNRTDQLISRLQEPEIEQSIENADIVLITIGANDIMQVAKENFLDINYEVFAKERVHYEERIRKIFSSLKETNPDAAIYLIGFYNPFKQYFEHIQELDMIVNDWNYIGKKVAESYGETFIPTKDLFMSEEVNLFAEDHFHPNETGYQRIAERILNYLVVE
ncbi:SGNH/GDSL hydrolase family protein [Ornithinibacillus xuwenensis]|uniref:SGNH/GDSL hydrolase family protein n=1 Tax=Ornithinibacillus xuwenensis TaxID=3144668 RepID=A0ABU9XK42_9BACI